MTTSQNTLYSEQVLNSMMWPLASDQDVNEGDMIYFDSGADSVKQLDDQANDDHFCGISEEQSPTNISTASNIDRPDWIKARKLGIFWLYGTAGQTYTRHQKVYVGADAQRVTNVPSLSGNHVGYIYLEYGQSPIQADGLTRIPVIIHVNEEAAKLS